MSGRLCECEPSFLCEASVSFVSGRWARDVVFQLALFLACVDVERMV